MHEQPIAPNRVIQFLLIIIVLLSLLAGYYHALYQTEVRKASMLEQPRVDILPSPQL